MEFHCPGCGNHHAIHVGTGGWWWNGSTEAPTFAPSVLATSGHYIPGRVSEHCWCTYNREHPNEPDPFVCYRCHSFVREGKIEFLSDSTHELAGKTVELPEWFDLNAAR